MNSAKSHLLLGRPPLHVSHWPVMALGWIGMLVFSWGLFLAFYNNQPLPGFGFIPFILLSITCLFISGSTEFDDQKIRHTNRLGRYEMYWDEVQELQFDTGGQGFVLQGATKRLALPGKAFWRGKDKQAIETLIEAQRGIYGFSIRLTAAAPYKLSKNVKVSNSTSEHRKAG